MVCLEPKQSTIYDQDDFDFESVADPFKSSKKMMNESPPLPRRNAGGIDYENIDFDAIENPFASTKKMAMDDDDFQSISTLNSGAIQVNNDATGTLVDQFQSKQLNDDVS